MHPSPTMGFEAKGGGTYFLMKLKVIMFNPNQGGGIRELKHSFLWNGIDQAVNSSLSIV